MHHNPLFRHDDPALLEAPIDGIGFGMVFATTPDSPRVAGPMRTLAGARAAP